MSTTIILAVAGLIGIVLMQKWRATSLNAEVLRAKKSQDLSPLVTMLANKNEATRANALNRAIRQLWDLYEREMAASLVKELAERHPEERITQYWLDQVQKVEPEVARKTFSNNFIEQYFRPEVARKCGNVG